MFTFSKPASFLVRTHGQSSKFVLLENTDSGFMQNFDLWFKHSFVYMLCLWMWPAALITANQKQPN